MKTYRQYINGEFRDAVSGEQFEVINPFTEKVVAMAPKGNAQDAALALEAASAAQKAWAATPCSARAPYLARMAAAIRANREMLARTLAEEQAKVLPLAQVEIDATAAYFDYYAGWSNKYEGEVIQSDRPTENILLYRQPIGVVVGICPWNFPFFVMARKVAPSILTGCTIILKPSSDTPNTTFEFARLIADIGLPKGVLNFVSGGGSTLGDALVRSPEVGLVTLTGSVETGQNIITSTAQNITKTSLELGGKAPVIVCADCDMDLTVKAAVASRVIFSGQVCNCAERVYVEAPVYDEFMERMTKAMGAVTYGDPFADPAPDMACQINAAQLGKIEDMVSTAKADGVEVLVGGKRAEGQPSGYFYEPTLLAGCTQDMEIVRKEIFGPVLPVVKVDDFDQAIDLANDCEYGLTSSIFTHNVTKMMRAINELKFGETYVNREHFESIQGFHAGWRKSGIGGADGKHGLYEYLQTHVAYIQY
ncbi:Aldehyde Dehydrogenase [Pseudodesulfovibrio mercurii]|uniref:Aldehyde Dehydrogenase n=1 Tax=Pseudodesulfovibrio mercurii TaxID=641491 RepID=F0JJ92_9BACT|nr:aldehyde dehydrogenase [Pseudodesulfovibrio mercurii]EGB15991.1 Aldehyde Dehydrogenase [Pseudodesulfovibrio mercurii]